MELLAARLTVVVITPSTIQSGVLYATFDALYLDDTAGARYFSHLSLENSALKQKEGLSVHADFEVYLQGLLKFLHDLFVQVLTWVHL